MYYHVGLHYPSPWRPTWHRVGRVPEPDASDGLGPGERRVDFDTFTELLTFDVGCKQLRLVIWISVQLFQLEEADLHITRFCASTVPAVVVSGLQELVRRWPRRVARRRAPNGRAPPSGGDDAEENAPTAGQPVAAAEVLAEVFGMAVVS